LNHGKETALLLVSEAGAWRRLAPGVTLTIGRAEDRALVLRDGRASKRHARVEWPAGCPCPRVFDEGSTNGVWVNGRLVLGCQSLPAGAQLVCGETRLMVVPAWVRPTKATEAAPRFASVA
jgi:pSer/pThr/pTyr-binding forkhead associated (FHA) protein